MNHKTSWFLACLIFSLGCSLTADAGVHALFDLGAPTTGPFPSDWFTAPDTSHNTRRRVDLPLPDCAVRQSDCEDLAVINTLDGFSVDPRLSMPFDGPIDVTTVTSQTVFLVRLGSAEGEDDDCNGNGRDNEDCEADGPAVGINQVVWDTFTNTLHTQSNELLEQHRRYALIVTRGVHDGEGREVEASQTFRRFRQSVRGEYRQALLQAVRAAHRIGVRESEIVTASVFTTQSTTAILEKIRDQIKSGTPEPADFRLGPGGARTVFPLDTVAGITWDQQTGVNPPAFTRLNLNIQLPQIIPGAVGSIAFGKYQSPDYEVHPGEYIPPVGTRTGTPAVQGMNELYFNLFLPSGRKPEGGWPVAIVGHGNGNNKNQFALYVAGTMAAHGIATIAINAVGAGFGALGTLTVNQTVGDPVTFSAGGRGIDQDEDNVIDANEGIAATAPRTIIFRTDGIRQTTTDLIQMVRVIEVGVDVDGDGFPDLDPSRIYYLGNSFGGGLGAILLSVEPAIRAADFTVAGSPAKARRMPSGRAQLGQSLASRVPPLINAPGVTNLGGVVVPPPRFDENVPLRDGRPFTVGLADGSSRNIQSPVINTVAGAMGIQQVLDHGQWVSNAGDAAAYAPHLRKAPLAGVPAKSVIVQFAKGDQSGGTPNQTALLRAGDLADRATLYRHDLAFAENPTLPTNPHTFMVDIPTFREISLGAQEQIAVFLASDGMEIIHPEPARFFQVPVALPLPEDLGFIVP